MDEQKPPTPTAEAAPRFELDPEKVQEFRRQLGQNEHLARGIAGGLVAAVVGGAIWAVVTVTTQYQIGWMAVGVGFLVGYAVRFFGQGVSKTFGVAGCLLALLGCLTGNLLSACGFVATQQSVPLMQVLSHLNPELAAALLQSGFSPMDLLFYGIAAYEGYRFSFRRITAEEVQALTKKSPEIAPPAS